MNNGRAEFKCYIGHWGTELLIGNWLRPGNTIHHFEVSLGSSYIGIRIDKFPEPTLVLVLRWRYRLMTAKQWPLRMRRTTSAAAKSK